MKLTDLLDGEQLAQAINERAVVRRQHPTEPLAILNYTDTCTFSRLWNDCTKQCRGLIYNEETGEVVARPFRKFFNHGEQDAPSLDLAAPCIVLDKLDGSLGIGYQTANGYAIATRGSFESEQAIHATDLYRRRYDWSFTPPAGYTVLWEIVYPGNRIVVDYGEMDDLVLLGAVEIATGHSIDPYDPLLASWDGPRAAIFDYTTAMDALAAEPRPNAEGLVIYLPESGERVKLKQADYVVLHRIVTGLNERTVWEHLKGWRPLDELLAPLPEEFHDWVRDVAHRLIDAFDDNYARVEQQYAVIMLSLPPEHTRKDFALAALRSEWKSHLFARYDGKEYGPMIWEQLKPAALRGPRAFSEATA